MFVEVAAMDYDRRSNSMLRSLKVAWGCALGSFLVLCVCHVEQGFGNVSSDTSHAYISTTCNVVRIDGPLESIKTGASRTTSYSCTYRMKSELSGEEVFEDIETNTNGRSCDRFKCDASSAPFSCMEPCSAMIQDDKILGLTVSISAEPITNIPGMIIICFTLAFFTIFCFCHGCQTFWKLGSSEPVADVQMVNLLFDDGERLQVPFGRNCQIAGLVVAAKAAKPPPSPEAMPKLIMLDSRGLPRTLQSSAPVGAYGDLSGKTLRVTYRTMSPGQVLDTNFAGDLEAQAMHQDVVEHSQSYFDKNLSDQMCSVCLDEIVPGDALSTTSCEHVFPTLCIAEVVAKLRKCPLCRTDLDAAKDLKRLTVTEAVTVSNGCDSALEEVMLAEVTVTEVLESASEEVAAPDLPAHEVTVTEVTADEVTARDVSESALDEGRADELRVEDV